MNQISPGLKKTTTLSAPNWGDENSSPGIVGESNGSDEVTGIHAYTTAGVYTVTLTVTDDDGGYGQSFYQYIVIYDPTAGFVTGGGWFNSPAGALVGSPAAAGKASFGFVAKYKKGASEPVGNTEFQFKAGNLNFHSTSYQWLVVTGGNTAKFKGIGTVNGAGEYKFQIWANDGDPDTFRIRIWTEDGLGNETDLYDNDAHQVIGGGNIVVHSK